MKDDLVELLAQMRVSAKDACGFVEGMSREEFFADKRTQQAVVMSLVIVGEAAARVMDRHPEFVAGHPQVPWRSMRGMRNRIAHGYFELDLDIVWDTVESALTDLLERMTQLIDPPESSSG